MMRNLDMKRLSLALPQIATLLFCLAFASALTFAQTITATVTGTVSDPNGALVPGATVTATSQETGLSKTATTNDEGRYTITFLNPGAYDIRVESSGFKRTMRSDIKLETAQSAELDFALSLGANNETVEVSSDSTPMLSTETSQLETTIESKLIEDLPTVDRNIFSFVNIVPGVIDQGIARGAGDSSVGSASNRNFFDSNFSVNGGRASSNDILLDGVTNTIGDFNGVAISPPQDTVREFKVQSGVAPAEFGRTAGGIVNISTKSGTNKFHGALYEYFQRGGLNANGWARNRRGSLADGEPVLPRIDIKRDQFGGAIGGPVYFPRFGEGGPAFYSGKNSTFFFFNYEARREDNPFSREITLPTAAMRQGDLSALLGGNRTDVLFGQNNPGGAAGTPVRVGQIYNPYGPLVPYIRINANGTTTQILGRPIIPNNNMSALPACGSGSRNALCLDPVAQQVMKYIPLPNQPGIANNFVYSSTTRFTRDIVAARIDHTVSEKQSFFARFSFEKRLTAPPNYFDSVAANVSEVRDKFGNFTINHVYSFSPSVINNFRYGYTRVRATSVPVGLGFNPTSLGLPSTIAGNAPVLTFPTITIGGGVEGQTPAGEVTANQIGGAGNDQPRDTHMVADSVTLIRGNHTIKTGAEYRLYRFYPFQYFAPTGSYSFSRGFTSGPDPTAAVTPATAAGSSMASFLLGIPSGGSQEVVAPLTIYHHYAAGFVQDDYRVRPNLVLNIGLRWDMETGTTNPSNLLPNFDFDAQAPLQGRLNTANLDRFVQQLNPGITSLRGLLDFPEGPQTKTNMNRFAPRVGFAYSINNRTTLRGGYGIFFLPISLEATTAVGVNLSNLLTQTSSTTQVNSNTVFLTNPFPNGLRGVVGNSLGSATGLGGLITIVEPKRANPYNQQWNLVLQRELARNLVVDLAYVGSRGVHLPARSLELNQISPDTVAYARANYNTPGACPTTGNPNNACTSIAQFFTQAVPNPFAGLLPGTTLNGSTIPRAQLLRRFPQYTNVSWFSPQVGVSTYNAFQASLQKRFSGGLSAVVNYTWSKMLDTSGAGNGTRSFDPTNTEDVYNYADEYSYSTLDTPHRFVASFTYELPFGRGKRFGGKLGRLADGLLGGYQVSGSAVFQSGSPVAITTSGFPVSGLAGIGNLTRRPNRVDGVSAEYTGDEYDSRARAGLSVFNSAAFAQPGDFQFGNAARTYNDVRRDTYRNVDLSIIKNVYFNEGRQKLQLRAEFLNAFNFVVFGTPGSDFSNPATFGVVTTQANRPRIIQLVGRFTF
jgi:hypothetical protein